MATSKLKNNTHRVKRRAIRRGSRSTKVRAKARRQESALNRFIRGLHPKAWSAAIWSAVAFAGCLIIIASCFYLAYVQTVLSFKVSPSVVIDSRLAGPEPTRIVVEGTSINLPIIPAHIKEGIWETSDAAATHLVTSAKPTEPSNIVIYGHNKTRLFGPLLWIKDGQLISLYDSYGRQYRYKVISIKTVTPDVIEDVLPTQSEVLTLYTCTGLFDSQRRIIRAIPV